jgi:hypothetical protein
MMRGMLEETRLVYGWGHRRQDLTLYGVTTGQRSAREAADLIGFEWMRQHLRPALNQRAAVGPGRNKWLFYRLLDGFGLPIPRTYGLYEPVHGITWDGERRLRTTEEVLAELHRLRPDGVVFKPCGGQQGRGLLILDRIDYEADRAVARTGQEMSLSDAVAGVDPAGMGAYPGYVLQEPVENHPAVADLAPWTANTLRIVTLVDLHGVAHVLGASATLGSKGSMASNWHAGGVGVSIDVHSGLMGRGLLADGPRWVEEHPDTGARFTGRTVPDWEAAVDACLRGALLFPGVRSFGWDVVISPAGPVILEANDGWDLRALQMHGRGLLGDERARGLLEAAGAPLPTGDLRRNGPGRLADELRTAARRARRRARRGVARGLGTAARRIRPNTGHDTGAVG